MDSSLNGSIFQVSNKPFSQDSVPDDAHAEATPGAHQKLIRQSDGRYLLIVREASGFIRQLPVMVFESGYLA